MADSAKKDEGAPEVSLTAEGSLVNKALTILLAMGNNRPKTITKLTNALNVRQCTMVTPFINPLDALDSVNKLSSDNPPPIVHLHPRPSQQVFVNQSEANKLMFTEAKIMADKMGRLVTVATEESKHFKNIVQKLCSWVKENPQGSKKSLLTELARQARIFTDCDAITIACRLQKQGIVSLTGSENIISYNLPSLQGLDEFKELLSEHRTWIEHADPDLYYQELESKVAEIIKDKSKEKATDSNVCDAHDVIIGSIKAVVMLCSTSTAERPSTMKELQQLIAETCKMIYVVEPSEVFASETGRECIVQRRKKKGKGRGRNELGFAIGILSDNNSKSQMQLSPEGFLGMPPRGTCCKENSDGALRNANDKDVVKCGMDLASRMQKYLIFIYQKRGTTPAEANPTQTKDLVDNLAKWVQSFENQESMDVDGAPQSQTSKLPTFQVLRDQLMKLCIGPPNDAMSTSELVSRLQFEGWITVAKEHPYQVSYHLTSALQLRTDQDQIKARLQMMHTPFMAQCGDPRDEDSKRSYDDCSQDHDSDKYSSKKHKPF